MYSLVFRNSSAGWTVACQPFCANREIDEKMKINESNSL